MRVRLKLWQWIASEMDLDVHLVGYVSRDVKQIIICNLRRNKH